MRPEPPKDYAEDRSVLRQELDRNPSAKLRIQVYLALIALVLVATLAGLATRAEAQTVVPFVEECPASQEPSTPCQIFNQSIVWIQAGDARRLSWSQYQNDVDTMVLEYDVQVLEFPPKDPQAPILVGTLPEGTTTFDWTPTRAGTYWARARTCRTDIPQDGEPIPDETDPSVTYEPEQRPDGSWILCSRWAVSIDPQDTNAEIYPRGFIYHATLPPATGGGIE